MPHRQLDRARLLFRPLRERVNRVSVGDHVPVDREPAKATPAFRRIVEEAAARIRAARESERSVILAMGAHTIKNGMAPTLIGLLEQGWITHMATNGAGIIHDWEFAHIGESSEHVAENLQRGQFGLWEETCRLINLAIVVGAYEGKGYGESIGSMIERSGVRIPDREKLRASVEAQSEDPDTAAAAMDLLSALNRFDLASGWQPIRFPHKRSSVQAAAFRLDVPFTGHPMFGQDIIYTHPMNHGAAIGRTALRDFLCFADAIEGLEGGVYLSIGSAVMSPMIFEKSLSMAQNLQIQQGARIDNHYILVVDLAGSDWDWQRGGEPPEDDPAYYLRYCKTFSRMGGTMRYLKSDSRDFLLALHHRLREA